EDYYTSLARQRLARLDAENAREIANLQEAKAIGDGESADAALQQMVKISLDRQETIRMHDQYMQSQQPPPRVELTQEERNALPPERMDPIRDAYDIASTSKYGVDEDGFKAGLAYVHRNRGR